MSCSAPQSSPLARARAALAAHEERVAVAAATPPAVHWSIPDLDVADLFADCPTTLAAIRAAARTCLSCDDLPALVVLAAVSCALAAKVQGVTTNPDGTEWRFWPHMFVGLEVQSGANKSRAADLLLRDHLCLSEKRARAEGRPMGTWTKMRLEQVDAAIDDEEERGEAKRKLDKLRQKEGADKAQIRELNKRLRQAKIEALEVEELSVPSPQKFVATLRAVGFRAAVHDEGAGFLHAFMAHGSDGKEQIEVLLDVWDGRPFRFSSFKNDERDNANPRFADNHGCILGLFQPGVLSPKTPLEESNLAALATRGLFPRFVLARPRPLLIRERHALVARAEELREVAQEASRRYGRILRALADLRVGDHPLAPSEPLLLKFTPEASRVRQAYQLKCGDDVAPDGPDHGNPAERSIPRLQDQAARIAVCLAALRCAERADVEEREVTLAELSAARVEVEDVERAIRACERYFRPHAVAVMRRAQLAPNADAAEEMLRILRSIPELVAGERKTKSELTSGKFRGPKWGRQANGRIRLDDALEELERIGEIVTERPKSNSRTVLIQFAEFARPAAAEGVES